MLGSMLNLCKGFRRCWLFVYHPNSYLKQKGFTQSLYANKSISKDGKSVPWLNYALTHVLESRLTKEMHMYEFGSGESTRYFADRVAHVVSVEHNASWYNHVRDQLVGNITLSLAETPDAYISHIGSCDTLFDVILVDGIEREACVHEAVKCLSQSGILILDDTHRTSYKPIVDFMYDQGFKSLEFESPKPLGQLVNAATIFYRAGNCLGI